MERVYSYNPEACTGPCMQAYLYAGLPSCQYTVSPVWTHYHHHHHRVARPSWRHFERSWARIHAVLRPRLWGRRSSATVRSHVRLGRPARHHQSAGGRLMAARKMCEWSCDGSALARCPNRRSRLFATGGWPVLRLTSSLVICAIYGICTIGRRHHWSNAREVVWRPLLSSTDRTLPEPVHAVVMDKRHQTSASVSPEVGSRTSKTFGDFKLTHIRDVLQHYNNLLDFLISVSICHHGLVGGLV